MIGLDAPVIALAGAAMVFANGGAGGEGTGSTADGHPGAESSAPNVAAIGGTAGGPAGDGGNGAAAAMLVGGNGGAAMYPGEGGGGGGGGAGAVVVYPPQSFAANLVSPPAT
jgi:hypothetical protein